MNRSHKDWRLVALGGGGVLLVALLAVFLPRRQSVPSSLLDDVSREIYTAVTAGDDQALDRARKRLRQAPPMDLFGSSIPGVLAVVEALSETPPACKITGRDAFRRGVCHIRRCRFDEALLAFARVPKARGGAVYRDLAARLISHHRRVSGAAGSGQP